eukprot:1158453-Pelagomonas_calceolata.AAC.3
MRSVGSEAACCSSRSHHALTYPQAQRHRLTKRRVRAAGVAARMMAAAVRAWAGGAPRAQQRLCARVPPHGPHVLPQKLQVRSCMLPEEDLCEDIGRQKYTRMPPHSPHALLPRHRVSACMLQKDGLFKCAGREARTFASTRPTRATTKTSATKEYKSALDNNNQRALKKDPTVSAGTNSESLHLGVNSEQPN